MSRKRGLLVVSPGVESCQHCRLLVPEGPACPPLQSSIGREIAYASVHPRNSTTQGCQCAQVRLVRHPLVSIHLLVHRSTPSSHVKLAYHYCFATLC